MRRLRLLFLLVLVLLAPTLAHATIIYEETFDSYTSTANMQATIEGKYGGPNGGTSCAGNTGILQLESNAANIVSVPHSLHSILNAGVNTCYANVQHPSAGRETWTSWRQKLVGYTPNDGGGTGSKQLYNKYQNGTTGGGLIVWHIWADEQWPGQGHSMSAALYPSAATPVLCPPGSYPAGSLDTACNLFSSNTSINIADGNWHCFIGHIKLSTGNTPNGIVEVFTDGVRTLNFPALVTSYDSNTVIDEVTYYAQQGIGNRYQDDIRVSNTVLTDCEGVAPPVDSTPPTVVTGVTVQGTTNTTATVTSAGASDAESGINSYRYELCAGNGCTNYALWHTFDASTLTVTLTGLTQNTVYMGRVNAQNGAGLLGTYSAIFTFTTTNTGTLSRRTLATDLFPQANENPLSSSSAWLGGYTNAWDCIGVMGNLKVVSHVLQDDVIGHCATMQYAAVTPPDDQWSQFTLGAFTSTFHEGGAGVRVTTPPAQIGGYFCHAYANPGFTSLTAIIFANVNRAPGFNILAQTGSVTWLTGDVGRCEVQGSTIRFYKNDVLILTGTDTEFTSGKTSLDLYIDAGGTPALTDMTLTGFAMGDWSAISGVTRRTLGTDTFNVGNINPLPSPWQGGYTGLTNLQIVGAAAEGTAAGGTNFMTRTDVLPNDQWAEATIGTLTGADKAVGEVVMRTAAPLVAGGYACVWILNTDNGHTSELYGPSGLLGSSASETWVSGDRARCEAVGTEIRLLKNDVVVVSVTDASATGGRVGLGTYVPTTLTNNTINTLTWGDWAVIAPPVIANAVTDSTGSTLTYGVTTPAFIRVQTDTTNDVLDIALVPAGRYTRPGGGWATGLTFVCFFAQDAAHTETGLEADRQCDSLAGLTIPADTTPPVLSGAAPSGTLAQGTTSTTISMTSDELADLKFSTTDVAYASMASSMTTVDGFHHSATVTGLTNGVTFTYYVRGQDRATTPNVNLTSSIITFQVSAPADTTAPILSAGSPTGTLAAGTTSVTMSVNTNENATCKYSSTAGVAYASMATTFTTGNGTLAHSTTVGSLVNGTTYTRYIKCIDGATNANTSDYLITWSIASPPVDTTPPVLSGGSPSGQLPAGTTSVLMQVNTNEAATCKYNTVAGRAWTHASSVLFTTTGGTAHSTTISGLSNGNTYIRYVKCRDVALNANTSDYIITWSIATPPAPDTIPPVRSGGSPSGALPSGTTSVLMQVVTNETATCKYGTVSSTAYAAIANTFSTTGGTTHSQTIGSLSDGTTLTYYVRCQDVALNVNTNDYTITWTITAAADVTPPIRSGGSPNGTAFPSGTVTVSMQLSTNESATCKYSATSAVAYGSMVSTFTTTGGTAHSVTIGVSNGTSYTFYVRCQDVAVNANTDDYAITWSVASAPAPDTTPPVLTLGGPTGTLPTTTTSVTLTVTSDEAATCKYGTAASTAYASIANTFTNTGGTLHTQTLSVAANTIYTKYIRCADVLNNANLVDYVITWSVAAAPDVTPAILSGGAPTGTLPTFTTSVTLQVTTSEDATCKYDTTPGTAYAAMAATFTTTGTTAHAQTIGSLSADTTYTYVVRCSDASGNANVVDYVITWYIDAAPDLTAPVRLDGSPSGVQTLGTTSVSMGLTTDENATCKYDATSGIPYANLAQTFGTTGTTSHSQTIGSLVNGQTSTYYVRCRDSVLNTNTTDFIITWSVAHDVTAPVRSAGLPSGVKVAGTTSVSMTLTTDENATCKYGLSPGVAFAAIPNTFTTTGTTSHSQTIGGLIDGQISTYFIRCQDASLDANANTTDYVITWSVAVVANDTTAPTAPTTVSCMGVTNTQAECTFVPGSDANGVTSHRVTIGISSAGSCTPDTIVTSAWGATSPQQLVGLTAGVTYCATLQSGDQAGNLSVASAQTNWTQPAATDPNFPTDVTGLTTLVNGLFATQVTLIWNASTHPQGIARYDTYRCTGDGCTAFDVHFSTPANAFTDTTVAPSTTYRYETFGVALSGNVSLNPSNILTVTTPALPPTQPSSLVCPCESH